MATGLFDCFAWLIKPYDMIVESAQEKRRRLEIDDNNQDESIPWTIWRPSWLTFGSSNNSTKHYRSEMDLDDPHAISLRRTVHVPPRRKGRGAYSRSRLLFVVDEEDEKTAPC
ncbi:hypothetical protein NM208_g7254 [Fusarium decemcellulare]|uniref:Uncharacterized protein n=1 Tax=Fusarium decemcellulare TaxID=57161 RepID=A0ACC1S9X9_9HYPO|nr:hypothetical protein NM208_g7254 [Fusarium decemcellulare]